MAWIPSRDAELFDEWDGSRFAHLAPTGAERYLWWLVLLSLTLDIALTYHGVNRGLTEANPIVRLAMERVGTVVALLSLKGFAVVVGCVGWSILPRKYRGIVPLGMALPWTIASLLNLSLLFSHVWF